MPDMLQYQRKIEKTTIFYFNNRKINIEKKTIKIKLPMQDGDVLNTWAYTTPIVNDYRYKPDFNIESRIKISVNLFSKYHQ